MQRNEKMSVLWFVPSRNFIALSIDIIQRYNRYLVKTHQIDKGISE